MPHLGTGAAVACWYGANVLFNIGMKHAYALVPDIMMLTSMQFSAAALVLAVAVATGATRPSRAWMTPAMACSSALVLCGTLCTNASLVLLSVSFTHVLKTLEPLFTIVIVYAWDGRRPSLTAVLAAATTLTGVLVASTWQRKSVGKGTDFGAGIGLALLANATLQLRNVLNKKLMASADSAGYMPLEGSRGQLKPMELLFVSLTAAMPAQLALHAVVSIAERLQLVFVTLPVLSRYAHYSPGAHVLWLLVPPVTFVAYQAASMLVLADVEPVMHAVLNTLKRVVVIGLSALWAHETISFGYALGAVVAVLGASAFSCHAVLQTSGSQAWLKLGLISSMIILLSFCVAPQVQTGPGRLFSITPPQTLKCPAREAISSCHLLPPAYVIVDRSSAKHRKVTAELAKVGFTDITIIAPVSDSLINTAVKTGRVGWHEADSPYARMGLTTAHANAWRDVVRRRVPQAMVFEDDVVFHEHFCKLLPVYARQLPCEPSVVYFGATMRSAGGIRTVHVGGDGTPPWDTHAYLVSLEAADLMTRRYDYSFLRMNISQLVPMPITKQDPGWDLHMSGFGSGRAPGPMLAVGAIMNADFFMMHTYYYFADIGMRSSWAWFDSTAALPAQVGKTTFVKDQFLELMPRFTELMEKAKPCFCGLKGEACSAQWTQLNARNVNCAKAPKSSIETIVRGTGLVYQSFLTPCELLCAGADLRLLKDFHLPRSTHDRCLVGIQRQVMQSLASLGLSGRPALLVDPATHNNLGDNMIMLGEMIFSQKMGSKLMSFEHGGRARILRSLLTPTALACAQCASSRCVGHPPPTLAHGPLIHRAALPATILAPSTHASNGGSCASRVQCYSFTEVAIGVTCIATATPFALTGLRRWHVGSRRG